MDIEFKKPEEIKEFQEGLLQEALVYLKDHSKYYQRMFDKYHIDIEKIRTIEDLQKIPFTEKKDLQLFNDEFLCCPKEKIVDYVTTSGTLGDPVTFGCTERTCRGWPITRRRVSSVQAWVPATSSS